MKRLAPFSHHFFVSGAAGTNNPIIAPRGGILRGIDIAGGAQSNEGAPANQYVQAMMFLGSAPDITVPVNDSEFDGCLAGVAQCFRANATFGQSVSLNKFVPLNLPINRNETFQLAYRVSSGCSFYGFFTFILEV